MDRSVSNFNVRLRTIKLKELFVASIVCVIITGILLSIFPVIDENEYLFFIILYGGIFLFLTWCLRGTTGLHKNFKSLFEIKTRNEILYVFAINLLLAFLFTCLVSGLNLIIGSYDPTWMNEININSADITIGAVLLEIFATSIFAPIVEELIFRGVIFNRLKIRVGIVPAMIISSFFFSIGHPFGGITSAFLFGICMCILYLKTDNILVPMSVHFTNNMVATILEFAQFDAIISQMPWIIPTTAISLIATVLVIKYIIQETSMLKKRFS